MKTKKIRIPILVGFALLLFPFCGMARDLSEEVKGLQSVLDKVYDEMIPLCKDLMSVAMGIAGFGALWYIASRVWGNIARAEPVDFYPLLRPFALGLAIMFFPAVLGVMNGVLKPTVVGTNAMVKGSDKAIKALLLQKELELKKTQKWKALVGEDGLGDRKEWYKYTHPKEVEEGKEESWYAAIGNNILFWADKQDYKMRQGFKKFLSEVLQLGYYAASLCINTVRTFFLIVLAILGPLVFGFAVFDGMQHTLSVWVARYINTYLWLPIANIFGAILGKIQQNMIKLDINEAQQTGDTFFSSEDTAYLIFMIIGIFGYFCVPNVANSIIHAGGGNSLLNRVNSMVGMAGGAGQKVGAKSMAGVQAGAGMIMDRFGDGKRQMEGMVESSSQDYFKDKLSGKSS